jgi:membrane-bound metal-dependent hydrolase YbcI (DUF457 family)
MPLPIGHTAIGLATFELSSSQSAFKRWKRFLFITVLANLPDIDVIIGLLLAWNGNAFHRGPTHSLLFALIAGFFMWQIGRNWLKISKISFRLCSLLILSHVIADAVFTHSPVSLFWPLEVNWSSGHAGWTKVVHTVLLESYQDGWILLGCAIVIVLNRNARRHFVPKDGFSPTGDDVSTSA